MRDIYDARILGAGLSRNPAAITRDLKAELCELVEEKYIDEGGARVK